MMVKTAGQNESPPSSAGLPKCPPRSGEVSSRMGRNAGESFRILFVMVARVGVRMMALNGDSNVNTIVKST